MKYEQLVQILFTLLSNDVVSASTFAKEFHVSKRTIYRHIDTLTLSGVPIVSIAGKKGGFKILESYTLPASFMTQSEFEVSINALEAFYKQLPSDTLKTAITKLKGADKQSGKTFDVKGGNLIIDASPWGDTVSYRKKLSVIEECIEKNLVLRITYHDRNGEITLRDIEPHLIIFKSGIWYIYAFCRLRGEFRLFKTGRIASEQILAEQFSRRSIGDYEPLFDSWRQNSKAESITFEIDKAVRSEIEEWLGIESVFEKDGKIFSTVKLPIEESLITKILSYGDKLTVLEPSTLQAEITKKALLIAKHYLK